MHDPVGCWCRDKWNPAAGQGDLPALSTGRRSTKNTRWFPPGTSELVVFSPQQLCCHRRAHLTPSPELPAA